MWTPLSASRWIFLLTMGVVTLFLASADVASPCCYESNTSQVRGKIAECYEQTAGSPCETHAFWVKPEGGGWLCISPKAKWLKKMILKKEIDCPEAFGVSKYTFEVLDEDAEA